MRLRILGASVSVVFEAGLNAAERAELRQAWSRCLEGGEAEGEAAPSGHVGVCEASQARTNSIQSSSRPFRARILAGSGPGYVPVSGGSFQHFSAELTSALTLAAIEQRGGELIMLHASGLADPGTGRTAALVGPSGVGKTTATRALARRMGYVTDETVGVEPSGAVVPYAKPLSVIVDKPPAPKRQLGPDALGLLVTPAQTRLGAVVLLERAPAQSSRAPEVRPLDHADAIVGLAPHTSSLAMLPDPLQRICRMLDACGGAVRAVYSEADDLAGLVPGLLSRPAVDGGWVPAVDRSARLRQPAHLHRADVDRARLHRAHLHRADVVDAVEIATPGSGRTELLVMVGQQVLRLGGIAPAIWRGLRTPTGLEGLVDRIAPEVGLPPDYEGALERAVEELSDYGVLTRS
ncbi:hypothetical protein [Sinomonas susongensis]|uniref:hypothetical protein n=1 Tax=Sinomonas susongensis TaxID=1324851 RepID=UPI0011096C42|nr:hypothetical protein [Sinomonas susongensis]